MKTVELNEKTPLAELVGQGEDQEVVVMQNGHAVALLVPFDDDDLEWYSRERAPEFIDSIAQARQQLSANQGLSHSELKKRLGLD